MITEMDDYLIHQTPDPVRFVGSSDRNFYDRYYFNMHGCDDRLFLIWGLGNYPNLGTQDAFVALRMGNKQHVLRTSGTLTNRGRAECGPIRIEVLEGLKRLRLIVDPNDSGIEADLVFEGAHPPVSEPRLTLRRHGRLIWDSLRYDQTGYYSGYLATPNGKIEINGPEWQGYRDRSWGIRPVGEPEPKGIMGSNPVDMVWFYCVAQFDEFTLVLKANDLADGTRNMMVATRAWNDPSRKPEELGPLDYDLHFSDDRQWIERATVRCPHAPGGALTVEIEQILPAYLMLGTGYDETDMEWRHGAYQGELKTEALTFDVGARTPPKGSLIDAVGRYRVGDKVGFGLFEYALVGNLPKFGIEGVGFWNDPSNLRLRQGRL